MYRHLIPIVSNILKRMAQIIRKSMIVQKDESKAKVLAGILGKVNRIRELVREL
jgi:hypothetical protein